MDAAFQPSEYVWLKSLDVHLHQIDPGQAHLREKTISASNLQFDRLPVGSNFLRDKGSAAGVGRTPGIVLQSSVHLSKGKWDDLHVSKFVHCDLLLNQLPHPREGFEGHDPVRLVRHEQCVVPHVSSHIKKKTSPFLFLISFERASSKLSSW